MSLANKTVVELKALLKKRGLPVAGRKAELIARLEEAPTKKKTTTEKAAPKKTIAKKKVPSSKNKWVYVFRDNFSKEDTPLIFGSIEAIETYVHKVYGRKNKQVYEKIQEGIEEIKDLDTKSVFKTDVRVGVKILPTSLKDDYTLFKIKVDEKIME